MRDPEFRLDSVIETAVLGVISAIQMTPVAGGCDDGDAVGRAGPLSLSEFPAGGPVGTMPTANSFT